MQLDRKSVEWAINSLERHGDTDLFPKPIELEVLASRFRDSVDRISRFDISNHQPSAPRRFIVPKDNFSYRAATQLDPLDSIILTALVHEHGEKIENRRCPAKKMSVFSYRFSPSPSGDLYSSGNAWETFWNQCIRCSKNFNAVLLVDISDFYNQISHHTIENQLIESGLPNQATKWILRLIATDSAKVSRGIPIGPHAAHILAEASLIPVDNSLSARGLEYCRFVDDIVIFADDDLTARTNHYQIAKILDKQQRLQLQKGKTKVFSSDDFIKYAEHMIADRPISFLEANLMNIVDKYSNGDPYRTILISEISDEDLKVFQPKILEKIIEDYLVEANPNFVRLRWFLRRLAQVGHSALVEFCINNFDRMIPAISELCQYFISVGNSGAQLDWIQVGEKLINLLKNEVIMSNEYFQMSILSLFNKETQLNNIPELLKRYHNSSPFLRREIILAAAKSNQADWIRELKEDVKGMDPWTKRAFFCATRQLPIEERKFFLKFASSNDIMESIIIDWAKS